MKIYGNNKQCNPNHRYQNADSKNSPIAGPVEEGKEKNEHKTRHFPEKLQHSALKLVQIVNIHKKIIQGRCKAANTDTPYNGTR